MAHLTLQLGGSVVVPFGAPWGVTEARRERVSVRRLRWKALSEAAAAQHPLLIQAAPDPCQGVLE